MSSTAGFAQWLIMAGFAALAVGGVRSVSDRAAWLLALVILLGVVIGRPDRLAAFNKFMSTVSR